MSSEGSLKYYYRQKELAIEYLGGVCTKCGTTEHLEFDHIDSNSKAFTICKRLSNMSLRGMKEELDKCQLLCHEHHVEKHSVAISHGTVSTYKKYKCRCTLCVAAKTKDTNEYRWRTGRRIQRVIQGSSNGSDLGP